MRTRVSDTNVSDEAPPEGLPTQHAEKKEQAAAAAFERIRKGHWLDWIAVGEGLMVGREWAMRRAGTNRPIGSAYNRAFGEWMQTRPWARDLDKPTRNHLFWVVENRGAVDRWRETLAQNVRDKLNHPTATKRRYEAEHVVREPAAPKMNPPTTVDEEIAKLRGEVDMRDREIEFLKNAPVKSGSLFDLRQDSASDIANVILGHVDWRGPAASAMPSTRR
jgi:hypothetical protein